MMAGFGVTIYQLQKLNRFRQVDGELETRVTALNKTMRDAYRDALPEPGGGGPEPARPFKHGPRRGDGPPPGDDRMRGGRFGPPDLGGERGPRRPEGPPPPDDFRGPPPGNPPRVDVTLAAETAAMFGPATGYYFIIWFRDGTIAKRSSNAPADPPEPSLEERDTLAHFRTRGELREALHCSGFGDCSMAGRSMQADFAYLGGLRWTLLGAGAAALAVGLGLGFWFIGRAIRPLEEIAGTAGRIADGNLSERIDVGDLDDELGHLARVLNATFARLDSAFARQRQFTSDAAHELRTPLSILISEAQTTLARERTAAEYRETIEGGLETAQQMRKLTEMLLELARFDGVATGATRQNLDLAEVAGRSVERLKPLAQSARITIRADLAKATAFTVHERVEAVIGNLLMNAIYYNRPGGEVRVTTRRDNGSSILEVSDTGIGIAAEDLPHIFDRFYRADKARSQSEGHVGLGLSICKTILDAERGHIDVASVPEKGTTFTVRFSS